MVVFCRASGLAVVLDCCLSYGSKMKAILKRLELSWSSLDACSCPGQSFEHNCKKVLSEAWAHCKRSPFSAVAEPEKHRSLCFPGGILGSSFADIVSNPICYLQPWSKTPGAACLRGNPTENLRRHPRLWEGTRLPTLFEI